MKFKVGDRVKVREDLQENCYYGIARANDDMAKKRGQIFTIKKIDNKLYSMKECNWFWSDEMLKKVEYTYEDLKKSPIGTKITFENGVFLIELRDNYYESKGFWREDIDLEGMEDTLGTLGKIIKIEEPNYTTVYEYKSEILDEAEKRYLRGVIRPFRDKVEFIKKFIFSNGKAKITIKTNNDGSTWYIGLPLFKKDTMYKGMEEDKAYTLEELGL